MEFSIFRQIINKKGGKYPPFTFTFTLTSISSSDNNEPSRPSSRPEDLPGRQDRPRGHPTAYRLTDNRVCQMGIDLLYRFLCGDMKSYVHHL